MKWQRTLMLAQWTTPKHETESLTQTGDPCGVQLSLRSGDMQAAPA